MINSQAKREIAYQQMFQYSYYWVGNSFHVNSMFSYTDNQNISPFLLLDYAGPTVFSPINEHIINIKTEQKREIDEVVILTTYGNTLVSPLAADGYDVEKIEMPAGPDHTFKFSKTLSGKKHLSQQCKLYIEAVNEQDEKI